MNKTVCFIALMLFSIAVSGCTTSDVNGGNGTTGQPPESLNWCIPGESWSGYAGGIYYEDATIHGISNMFGYWNCHVRSADGSVDIYVTDYDGTDAVVETV